MKYRVFLLTVLMSFLVSFSLKADSSEKWRTYLSYANVEAIVQTPNKIYAISNGALFSYDKLNSSIETYSKTTGLSDNGIVAIKYSETDEALFVVYQNSNIDLITPRGIFNIPDLEKKMMTGNKAIYDIYFDGNGMAYLSTGFGIAKVNINKREFSDTYIIGEGGTYIPIASATVWGDSLYALSGNKLYAGPLAKNLSNYQNWVSRSFGENDVLKSIVTFDNKLILLQSSSNRGLYMCENESNGEWTQLNDAVNAITISQERLNVSKDGSLISYAAISTTPATTTLAYDYAMGIYDLSADYFYIAAKGLGLAKITGQTTEEDYFKPSGPAYNDPFWMKFKHGKLYVTTSGTWVSDVGKEDIPGGVMIFDSNKWFNITNESVPQADKPFQSVLEIAVDDADPNHYYVSTWGKALYEFRNNNFYQRFNYLNSDNAIQLTYPDVLDYYQIVNGLLFDKDGNLWMNQSYVSNAIKVLKKDGTWKSFYFPNFTNRGDLEHTLIDANGYVWVNQHRLNPGLFVFNYNGTIDNTADDKSKFLDLVDTDGRAFSSTTFRCMVLDKANPQKMWVGTSNGPITIPNTKKAFDSDFRISRIKIPRNDGTNLADYLLENELINDIYVDGGNRKWLATGSSGVLLVSEDGTETIRHYTTENSPLLSDNVLSVTVNPDNGEVFFGTDQGIISIMGDASEPNISFTDVHAYPNPVRENYLGTISIVGLMEKSDVKITDVAGNLVYETTSNGGMATWDGTDSSGNRVSTGVYLAICSTPDAKNTSICKILIINK